ncbi:GDSL esterase/lipase 7-like [Apium graveolens]|uniref:GDSL esterase/lipase 7-like n=1 Tax=Apium graveolens TaxID=4045 RepID=UPI003D7A8846
MGKLCALYMRFLLFFFIIFTTNFPQHVLANESKSPLAPALFVMGDSLFDSGNNNLLPTLAKANFLPYGHNFARGSTGRFTNGRTVADFIAEFLGLPYSPPYISSLRKSSTITGFNYASATCGILPETGLYIGKCLNLGDQINLFERTVNVNLARQFESSTKMKDYLSKSIFVISIGSNDYINNYLQPNIYASSLSYSPQSFAKLLNDALFQHFQKLYKLGARKVVIFELGPIGCIPSVTRQYKHSGKCVEEINQLVNLFNNQLRTTLTTLTSTLKGSAFVLGHLNGLGYDAIINSNAYGLTDSSNPCCITWQNGTSGCIPGSLPCRDADKHYFWDGFHLTEAIYFVLGKQCINDNKYCIPMSIKQLVHA